MPTDDELQRIYDERTGIVPVHPRTLDGLRAAYEAGVAAERERIEGIVRALDGITWHRVLMPGEPYPSVVGHSDEQASEAVLAAIRADDREEDR